MPSHCCDHPAGTTATDMGGSGHLSQVMLPAGGKGPKADPLKGVKGFARAPKKGGHQDEELTEMEVGWLFCRLGLLI